MPHRSVAVAATVILLGSCSSSDGRVLAPPDENRTTTSVSAPTVASPAEGGELVEMFSLGSPAFGDGGEIPAAHTCAGAGISPPLTWASTPPGAELALVMRDRTAGGFVHWVVTGIDPAVGGLGEGAVPEGAVEALNGAGSAGWTAPCPPGGIHTYAFSLHVLTEPLTLEPGAPADQAAQQVEGTSTTAATLVGTVTAGA